MSPLCGMLSSALRVLRGNLEAVARSRGFPRFATTSFLSLLPESRACLPDANCAKASSGEGRYSSFATLLHKLGLGVCSTSPDLWDLGVMICFLKRFRKGPLFCQPRAFWAKIVSEKLLPPPQTFTFLQGTSLTIPPNCGFVSQARKSLKTNPYGGHGGPYYFGCGP